MSTTKAYPPLTQKDHTRDKDQKPDKEHQVEAGQEGKKKKKGGQKKPGFINIYGEQFQGNTKIEGFTFFQDLNYGDMVIVFNNPFYDFQLKERQEIEMYQLSHLALLKNKTMGKISMSPSETKKFEKRQADETARINQKFKDLAANDAKKNIRIDLLDAYQYYNSFINIRPENLIESR
jgi:hypothetical protein